MVSSNHSLLFVQLFEVISTSSPDCVEPHAPGTPYGTCPPQPEPRRCCLVPLQPPVLVTPYAATKPTASTSSSHPENYKYSQPCTARLSGQWNGAAATMVSSNHFLLFVQSGDANLFRLPENPFGLDLFAIDIERGRDHGTASYAAYVQRLFGITLSSFDDLYLRNLMLREVAMLYADLYE
ncbi:hypothetical protein MRX96_011760 [Rhipicephalus microplus]